MNPVPVPALVLLAFEHRAPLITVPVLSATYEVDATAVAHADTSRRAPRWGA